MEVREGMDLYKTFMYFLLFFVLIVLLSVFISLFIFTSPEALVSAILSEDVKFAIFLTILTATCSTIISLAIGVPIAYLLSRSNFPGKPFIEALIEIPAALPPISLGVALLIFFTNTPIGAYINNSIVRFVFEPQGIILAQIAVIYIYTVRVSKSVFDGIDVRYERIARTLGYSEFKTFTRITFPMARNGILGAAILSWARAIGEFGASVTLAGATKFKTSTLPILLFLSLSEGNIEKALAIITIILALSFSTFLSVRILYHKGAMP